MGAWAVLLILAPAVEAALLVVTSMLERRLVEDGDQPAPMSVDQSVDRSLDAATPSSEISAARNGPAMSAFADREAATSA